MNSKLADLPLLSRLLDEALGLPPEQVEGWIAALPFEQEHLRPRLRAMLALHLSRGHASFMSGGPKLEGGTGDDTTTRSGDLVGPYRLIREIGRGGMGAVWLADRADGALKRQVALKLPRLAWGARLGERMARERDIGALLEHPSIARLYDAGVNDGGRPYLALEYVDGQPIDAWCKERALAMPDRLRLFVQVARAVAYAHGRLVVHRDLKPANVLVTPDGRAHLLDFGIARLLQESAPDDERSTEEPERVLTPLYASPEQLRGEVVTVASDVYSLGVVLFELLTGRLPHEPVRKGLAALEDAVLGDEPPLASSRAREHRTATALRGELDAILKKALKRNPDERYATADAMAEDIERHLGGERVLAQPDSLGYRLAIALRRHWIGFAAGAAVLLAVLGGTVASVIHAKRANDAADRERLVKQFVIDIFKVSQSGKLANPELRQLPVELLLERGAKLIETQFMGQPPLQAELYGVLGGIFAGMGAHELAGKLATQQMETQAAIGASASDRAQATLLLARALAAQGRVSDAKASAQSALALAGPDRLLRPKILALLAHVLFQQGSYDEGLHALDEAERNMKGMPALIVDAARAKAMRAGLLVFANRFDEAGSVYVSAIDEAIAAEGPLSPTAIDIRIVMANNLADRGRAEEARPHREAALAALRASGGAGEVRAALEESELHKTLFLNRQIGFDEARAAIERNRSMVMARGPVVPARVRATIDFGLGTAYLVWGDLRRGDPLISDSMTTLRSQAEFVRDRYRRANIQGIAAMYSGRHDQAEAFFRDEIEMQGLMGADRHPDRVFVYVSRALNRSMQGRYDEAEAILAAAPAFESIPGAADAATIAEYREVGPRALARVKQDGGDAGAALALLPVSDSDETAPYPFDHHMLRGEILCALGRRAEGLVLLERSLKAHQDKDYEHSPHMARARSLTGVCALAAGQRKRADELAALARASLQDQPDASPYFRRPSEHLDELLRRGDRATGPGSARSPQRGATRRRRPAGAPRRAQE